MKKSKQKHARKIRNLVAICSLCAILLSVSTYAWFIGMKTVNVASFDVDIATTEGLFLSVDGENWAYRLDARNATPYEKHANVWAEDGLIPMSSVGDMDSTVSRLKLFEKASLTTTKGGYRLLSSRVQNHVTINATTNQAEESDGYVAFDLFIKNISGDEYYETNNELNEEAIYLTINSAVTVATGGVQNTGIENSVRVGFAQIGRVKADTASSDNITKITCSDVAAGSGQVKVTGICRNARIWEPNDKAHVQNAINWYNTTCLPRLATGTDVTVATSYDTGGVNKCGEVEPNTAYDTYAISNVLNVGSNVDVYDGSAYNGYGSNVVDYAVYNAAADKSGYKLVKFPYFTDTMKMLTSTQRPPFMTLAPNSITKVRVYVWLEGQDVDNYDFASLGSRISINFGFTKERFTETDVHHVGPSTDITPTATE